MNHGEMNHPQNEFVVEEMTANTAAEVGDEVVAETVAARGKKKRKKKIFAAILSIVLVVAIWTGGAAAAYANFVGMPDPLAALLRTIENKYVAETVFNMEKLSKEGKMETEIEFAKGNALSLPKGKLSFSASVKKRNALLTAQIYDERLEAYITKDEIAASISEMNDGKYYGVPFENFREDMEDSIFDPDDHSNYALDEATFEMLCRYVEMLTGKKSDETKELEKDTKILLKLVNTAFRKSELSDTEKDYQPKEILGERRLVRTETYFINEDTVRSFLETLEEEMDEANTRTLYSYMEFRDRMNDMGHEFPSWQDLKKEIREEIDKLDMGDLEIELNMHYKATYVSAIVITGTSEEEALDLTLTIDFGKDPTKSVDTLVDMSVSWKKESLDATVTLASDCEEDEASYGDQMSYRLM